MDLYEQIDKLVLEAKCGNKSSFDKIWDMYQPLMHRIVRKVISEFPSARQHEFDIKNDCYIYFWDIINSFDFNDKYYFSYFLKRELIKMVIKNLKNKYIIEKENIRSEHIQHSLRCAAIASMDLFIFRSTFYIFYHYHRGTARFSLLFYS